MSTAVDTQVIVDQLAVNARFVQKLQAYVAKLPSNQTQPEFN